VELIAVGKILWLRRRLIAAAFVVAMLVGVAMCYSVSFGLPPKLHGKQHEVGQGAAQVLIDTPSSQLADLGSPNDPATQDPNLYSQASLLADVVATQPIQDAIAAKAGIPADALVVKPPTDSVAVPIRATPLALAGKKAEKPGQWTLAVTIDPSLPIIAFSTVAPTPDGARRLASAAIAALAQHLDALAAAQRIPNQRRLVVNTIDPPGAAPLAVGPRKMYAVAVAMVLFFALSFGIVVLTARRQRRALGLQESDSDDLTPVPESEDLTAAPESEDLTASLLVTASEAAAATDAGGRQATARHARTAGFAKSSPKRWAKGNHKTPARASD
jgi:hypothetical protein